MILAVVTSEESMVPNSPWGSASESTLWYGVVVVVPVFVDHLIIHVDDPAEPNFVIATLTSVQIGNNTYASLRVQSSIRAHLFKS